VVPGTFRGAHSRPPLRYHRQVRIGIIGAGIIGCSVGWRLARHGADVTLFEQHAVGGGATRASAGALVPYVEAKEWGPLQELVVRSLNMYDVFIEELRGVSRRTINYERCGSLEVAFTESEECALRAAAARAAADGTTWLEAAEAREMEPALSEAIRGAVFVGMHGRVSAPGLTAALAEAAAVSGAVFRSARVTGVREVSGGAQLLSDTGATEPFDRVIVATGAWSSLLQLNGHCRVPVRPVKGQLLRLRGVPVSRLLWSHGCYVVPQGNHDLLVGATMEEAGFDDRPTTSGMLQLLRAAQVLVPQVADAEFVEARVGLRPATTDSLPILGYARESESLIYSVGHFRNGIVLAPLTARILADLVLDDVSDPALAVVAPGRFGL
jgi:glycine oxidase